MILFCNGPWCGQSPAAVRAMIEPGYPAERISYYRGGMLAWRLLGLTVAGGGAVAQDATSSEAQGKTTTSRPVADDASAGAATAVSAPSAAAMAAPAK